MRHERDCVLLLRMKVVLQNKQTELFFAIGNRWVSDLNKALTFENSVDAEQCCRGKNFRDVQILIKTGIGENIILPCCSERR